ncbi:hypothetical protein [Natronincola peptidivorans]|uniref:hypothetical protein n=1 Tax=Natronincola peptidivorans TaxID=426128 RepID=UPI00147E9CAE|nr:hypothetical protein [Natronincola peptidivorans]
MDNSISVFAELVKTKPNGTQEIYKFILQHLKTCGPREVAKHTERAFICINDSNSQEFRQVIYNRG